MQISEQYIKQKNTNIMNEVKYKEAILKRADREIDRLTAIGSAEEGAKAAYTGATKSQWKGTNYQLENRLEITNIK